MAVTDMPRLGEMGWENARLQRLYEELSLDYSVLSEAPTKTF